MAKKCDENGRWPLENPHPGRVHFEMEGGAGEPSRWNTLRALRVLRWANVVFIRRMIMRQRFFAVLICAALGIVVFGAQTQTPPTQPPQTPTSADPYAGNAAAGTTAFPLAAPAGKDSNARNVAPPGAMNRGLFDPATWKYGPAFNPPPAAKIWNPMKLKMQQGAKLTGGTLLSATDPSTYCAMANAGYDFIWTEMQHDSRDWQAGSPHVANLPERESRPGRARCLHR